MKALMYMGPRELILTDIPEPSPAPNEIKIKVKLVGICGSDVHGYTGATGRRIPPMVMGHEMSGVVSECGSGATKFQVGDRVVVQPVQYCGECKYCKENSINICANRKGLGVMDINGGFTEYVCMNEKFAYKLADSVSDESAALMDPVSVAYHAVKKILPLEGKNIMISGAGTIGLLVLKVAKLYNPQNIAILDMSDDRLWLAKEYGATVTINPAQQDIKEELEKAGIFGEINCTIECVGATPTAQQTINYVQNQGTVLWVGNAAKMININMQEIVTRELSVFGCYAFTEDDFAEVLELLEKNKLNVTEIISGIIPLHQAPDAFESLAASAGKDIKIIVDMDAD